MSIQIQSIVFLCAAAAGFGQEPVLDIVHRSLDLDRRNEERARDYTYQQRETLREVDSGGRVKSSKSRTFDVMILEGRRYRRLIEENGKPLKKPEEPKPRHDSDQQRAKTRKFLTEIPTAYNFRLLGEEMVSGKPAWVVEADPKPGYRAHDSRAKMFANIRGKLWIDKAEYQWVKVEAETTGTIWFGLFLVRLASGSSLKFEQRRVNDEVWLPSHAEIAIDGRLALVKQLHAAVDITYANYRKFQTDSKVISTQTMP